MALWGISTTTETAANNYALPKHLMETDRNTTPWNCFADERGWIYRRYGTSENSGLSTNYYDEVLVPVAGLNTTGISSNTTGLGLATPVAVFFEDPNKSSIISVGGGATTGIGTGTTGYVHVVFNELVYASKGATVNIKRSTGGDIVAYAGSFTAGAEVVNFVNGSGLVKTSGFDGQITNRVSFAFTAPSTGIGTVLSVDATYGFVGVITDSYNGAGVTSSFTEDLMRNIGGSGSTAAVGVGTTTLTIKA
jgi:hypothetical protein